MNPWIALLAALVGYLLGAVSFTRMVGSFLLPGEDVGNAEIPIKGSDKKFPFRSFGATSIRAKAGAKYGCLTSVLDMMKVTLPTLAFKTIYPEGDYFLVSAAAGVAGHNFPVYYRFKGGEECHRCMEDFWWSIGWPYRLQPSLAAVWVFGSSAMLFSPILA